MPEKFIDYLPSIAPSGWSYSARHLVEIGKHLDAVTRGEIDRLAIFMPPRHAKSETVTIRYPVYRVEGDRTLRCLVTGYNERFARKFGRKSRNIASERFTLANDKLAADEWETPEGGGLVARGVGSPPTGYGFNLICIDDPIRRREDAESEVYREKLWDWYTDDLYTRLEPNGVIILTLTRWHHDDLAARALASEPGRWTILKLPALAEEDDPIGRAVGEALWPERHDIEKLHRIRDVQTDEQSGASAFESLYQQNPTPREGAFFKVAMLGEPVDAAPAMLRTCRAWDLAASTKGDYTVGLLMGVDANGQYYILDVIRGQWLPDERNATMRQTAALDKQKYPNCRIRLPQDPGQAGVDQVQSLVRMLAGYSVKSERVTGSKETRADAFAAQVNAGNVKLVKGKWNAPLIEEFRTFPLGKNDDQVDASADSFLELTTGIIPTVSPYGMDKLSQWNV
ncbi:MAG TPA: phage terminase large subunit [Blastocatellia bacterium]|nr:phage terminase large subunit [Blastocatellia bacterium]